MKFSEASVAELANRFLVNIRGVQQELGRAGRAPASVHDRFADLLDSMGLVEFLLQTAEECGITPEDIEACVERQFTTVWDLAVALHGAGLAPAQGGEWSAESGAPGAALPALDANCWLGSAALVLPARVQPADEINAALQRPLSWLQEHAGIQSRRLWREEDPLAAGAEAGRQAVERSGLQISDVRALLVTSEAPPQLVGLAAALHHRLGLEPSAPALEIGGACTGFLAALWLARQIMSRGPILVLALEAPSRLLKVEPGPSGEAAALFGDGAAACVLGVQRMGEGSVPLVDVAVGADGSGTHLLTAERSEITVSLKMDGQALAARAVRVMADNSVALLEKHGLSLDDVQRVVAHGGNGRMPALLARKLDIPVERMCSETARLGNLGSASLPAAWATNGGVDGPALWTTVGAGLVWAVALTGLGAE